jgi:hypothetical protein
VSKCLLRQLISAITLLLKPPQTTESLPVMAAPDIPGAGATGELVGTPGPSAPPWISPVGGAICPGSSALAVIGKARKVANPKINAYELMLCFFNITPPFILSLS